MQCLTRIMTYSTPRIRLAVRMAWPLGAALAAVLPGAVLALPQGAQIASGAGAVSQSGAAMTVQQTSPKLAVNWQSFGIGAGESVHFNQPGAASIALNRVLGQDASQILGSLTANGQVFLTNPNGILFGPSAQVSVGGLVASTNNLSDADFQSGQYRFTRSGNAASIVNQGNLTAADGGYIALLGPQASNQGVISARLGAALLAAGDQVTVHLNSGSLVGYNIDKGVIDALAANHSLIKADGGQVFMSAGAADQMARAVVSNEGVIEAQTIGSNAGLIQLRASQVGGEVTLSGRLDASAPNGGNGGVVETSAAVTRIAATARTNTFAPQGKIGHWLIELSDAMVADDGTINPAALGASVARSNVTVQTTGAAATEGSISINSKLILDESNTLTFNAQKDINLNAEIVTSADLVLRSDRTGTGVGRLQYGTNGLVTRVAQGHTDVYYNPVSYVQPSDESYVSRISGPLTIWMLVNNVGQLQAMNTSLAGNYALGRDIEAGATRSWNNGAGFAPIGGDSAGSPFSGQFDGLQHTINGLFINRPTENKAGLFASTTNRIANLGLTAVDITGAIAVANSSAGALAAVNSGRIENAFSNGVVKIGVGGAAGGLVGVNSGTLEGVYSQASVTGFVAGGVAGNNTGTINNAYSTGDVGCTVVAGGLVGSNNGAISNAYSRSKVSSVTQTTGVGGLVGAATGGSIVNAYWDRGLSGQDTSAGGGTRLESAQMLDPTSFSGLDPAVWRQYEGHTAPLLKSFLKPLAIALSDQGKEYDGQGWTGLSNVRYGDAAAAPANVFSTAPSTGKNAGTYTSAPQFWSNQQGYDLSFSAGKQTAQQTIDPALLKLGAAPDSKTYDGTAASSVAVSVTGLVAGDTASAGQTFDSANAGARTLLVDRYAIADGNGGANYAATRVAAKGVIARAPLAIRANDAVVPYTGTPFGGGNGVSYEGLVADEKPSVLSGSLVYGGSAQGALGPGAYRVVPGGLESSNYAIVNIDGALTITRPAQLDTALSDARAAVGREPGVVTGGLFQPGGQVSEGAARITATGSAADPELRIVDGGMRLPTGLK